MKDWKTTVVGILGAIIQIIGTPATKWQDYILPGVTLLLGIFAKDSMSSGNIVKNVAKDVLPFLFIFISLNLISIKAESQDSVKWVLDINSGITAVNIEILGSGNYDVSTLDAVTFGVSIDKTNLKTGNVDFSCSFNLLQKINWGGTKSSNIGIELGIGLFNKVMNFGIGWYAKEKYPCILTGINILPVVQQLKM